MDSKLLLYLIPIELLVSCSFSQSRRKHIEFLVKSHWETFKFQSYKYFLHVIEVVANCQRFASIEAAIIGIIFSSFL